MVTTNSTEEIRDLMRRALTKTTKVLVDLEDDEKRIEQIALTVLNDACRLVKSVLPYVDQEIEVINARNAQPQLIRGIYLNSRGGEVMARDGGISTTESWAPDVYSADNTYFDSRLAGYELEQKLDYITEVLESLAAHFKEALQRIDRRRESLDVRRRKLETAAEIFKTAQ